MRLLTSLLVVLVGCSGAGELSAPIVSGFATIDGTPYTFTESAHFHDLGARLEASAHSPLGMETLGVVLPSAAGATPTACSGAGSTDVAIEFTGADGAYHGRPSGPCSVTVRNPLGDGDGLFRVEFSGTVANAAGTSEVEVEGYLEAQDVD